MQHIYPSLPYSLFLCVWMKLTKENKERGEAGGMVVEKMVGDRGRWGKKVYMYARVCVCKYMVVGQPPQFPLPPPTLPLPLWFIGELVRVCVCVCERDFNS